MEAGRIGVIDRSEMLYNSIRDRQIPITSACQKTIVRISEYRGEVNAMIFLYDDDSFSIIISDILFGLTNFRLPEKTSSSTIPLLEVIESLGIVTGSAIQNICSFIRKSESTEPKNEKL